MPDAAGFSATVAGGPLLVAMAVSALVGLIGFLSPCVLPLIPGYLSYLAGLTGEQTRPSQRRMIAGSLLFAVGFTAVLVVSADVFFVGAGRTIADHRVGIERVLGGMTIALGAVFLGAIGPLQRELRVRRLPRAGLVGAPLLGATFGLAWTPCLTPTFTAVVGLATSEPTAGRGLVLTIAYCLGLSVPFVLLASGLSWMATGIGFIRRHMKGVHFAGGALLVAIGVLLVTGEWTVLMNQLRAWSASQTFGSGL